MKRVEGEPVAWIPGRNWTREQILKALADAAWEARMDGGCHSRTSEILTVWHKHLSTHPSEGKVGVELGTSMRHRPDGEVDEITTYVKMSRFPEVVVVQTNQGDKAKYVPGEPHGEVMYDFDTPAKRAVERQPVAWEIQSRDPMGVWVRQSVTFNPEYAKQHDGWKTSDPTFGKQEYRCLPLVYTHPSVEGEGAREALEEIAKIVVEYKPYETSEDYFGRVVGILRAIARAALTSEAPAQEKNNG